MAISDLAGHPWLTLVVLGLDFVAFAAVVRRLETSGAVLGSALLGGALLIRLPLLALAPTLSDDVWRYLWDGRVVTAAENPYLHAPEDPALSRLRDARWERLPHKQVPTVYPPLAMAAFSIASRSPAPLLTWKLIACAADLLACWLLFRLAQAAGRPPTRALWYAWNPLVALEVAGMGHVDALGAAAMIAAVLWLIEKPRVADGVPWKAGVAAAAGVLIKLAPLAALPLWAKRSGRPAAFVAIALGLSALALAPVVISTGGIPPGLTTYGVSWEWNGPLYEPLWRLLEHLGADRAAQATLDGLKVWTGEHGFWNRFYPFAYPRFLAKLLLGGLAVAAVMASLRERDAVAGTGRLFARLLLCSATLYPWYLLWVLPFAALERHRAWLLASALLPLVYLPPLLGFPLYPGLFFGIWGAIALTRGVTSGWGAGKSA